ncbi:FHA domain-containing protein [Streptomyces sp. A012304]|uniref:FHA domain-containing protein n=1 Tax=Streptomyces sp. A012304 TaxID=375446 RepID=UPI00222F76C5|nr:FHA domain-containing protein [Streptomyces sp. A012304]GKQ36913.1 hypothetical protein ALMP_34530 [Streptomyces sp. A012304]
MSGPDTPRPVDKSLADDVFFDDEREDDDFGYGGDGDYGYAGDGERFGPEPPEWVDPPPAPSPQVPAAFDRPCWSPSCGATVPGGAAACPECQESVRHLRLISTRPPVDLRHGTGGPLNLGRDPLWAPAVAADLDGEPGVSRRHASIELTPDDGAWLTEPSGGTTNGTFVNGVRVEAGRRVRVGDGDTVRLGRHCAFTLLLVEPAG